MDTGRRSLAEQQRGRVMRSALAALVTALSSSAVRAADPLPMQLSPVAVRGGVVAVPIRLPAEGEGYPASLPLTLKEDGRATEVLGRVVYLATPTEWAEPRWTRSANPTVVRTVDDGADPRALLREPSPSKVRTVDAALLLVDVPMCGAGATLTLGGTTITPAWIEPAPALDAIGEAGLVDAELVPAWSDDRPDPASPFEWFRWVLIAGPRGERIPAPPGDAASQLFARHVAELWLAGLDRIERQSKGVADSLRDWLTATVHWAGPDGKEANGPGLAMWIADPGELSALLGILLDRGRGDAEVMNAALAWMDARTPMAMWVESDIGGKVTLAVANPLVEELVVKLQWIGEMLPPIATLLPFRSIDRVRVDRPAVRPGPGDMSEPIVLAVDAGALSRRLSFAPRGLRARAPSVSFGTFLPALTLADIQAGRVGTVPQEWSTTAMLRRRDGHWEIFAECLTPRPDAAADMAQDSFTIDLRGRTVIVRRDGSVEADLDGVPDVGVRNYADRWRVRVALPDAWMPRPGGVGAVMAIGLRRDAPVVHATAVLARAACTPETPLVEIDVSDWSDAITPRSASPR